MNQEQKALAAELNRRANRHAFDADQPRAKNGQFGSGGGGAHQAAGKHELSKEGHLGEAKSHRDKAAEHHDKAKGDMSSPHGQAYQRHAEASRHQEKAAQSFGKAAYKQDLKNARGASAEAHKHSEKAGAK